MVTIKALVDQCNQRPQRSPSMDLTDGNTKSIPSTGLATITGDNPKTHRLKQRFKVIRKLGQGTYGKVQLALDNVSGQHVSLVVIVVTCCLSLIMVFTHGHMSPVVTWNCRHHQVAIKTIKKSKIESEQDLVRIRREIQIMSSIQHPHIIHIFEGNSFTDSIQLFLVSCHEGPFDSWSGSID